MATLTVTPDSAHSWARLDADFSDVLADAVAITRTRADTGATVPVRIAGPSLATTEVFAQMNANPDFEGGITNWTALGGATLAQSTLNPTRGTHSLQITSAAGNGAGAESEKCPVIPGQSYSASAYVFTSALNTLGLGINWYNASNTLISTTVPASLTANPSIGLTALIQVDGQVAPPGAATATVAVQYATLNSAGSGTVFRVDEVRLLQAGAATGTAAATAAGGIAVLYDHEVPLDVEVTYTAYGYVINGTWAIQAAAPVTATAVQVDSAGLAWLKDPGAPANSVPIAITTRALLACIASGSPRAIGYGGIGTETRAAKASTMDVNNSEYPIVTAKRRGSVTASLILIPHTFADREAIRTLDAPGATLLFQAPGAYGVPDRYMAMGDEQVGLLGQDQRFQPRGVTLPFTVVAAPVGPAQGPPGARYGDLCQTYGSWNLLAAGTAGAADGFGRTVASGLGTADAGGTYVVEPGDSAFSVAPGVATVTAAAQDTPVRATLPVSLLKTEISMTVQVPALALGSYFEIAPLVRFIDDDNYFALCWRFNPDGSMTGAILAIVGGNVTTVATGTQAGETYAANSVVNIYATVTGDASPTINLKGWVDGTREPTTAAASGTGTGLTAPGAVGFEFLVDGTNALPFAVKITQFRATGSETWLGVMDGGA